jgi:16S rRNA (adenine(1408)-N(1))-methyltransferase
METIRGKTPLDLNLTQLYERLAGFHNNHLDLGTGDGRYVHALAERNPDRFFIGIDSCRENLQEHSRVKLPNMLFVIASAQDLPREMNGLISQVTINFPWGSLLRSLLTGDPGLMRGLESVSRSGASLDIRVNSGALAEAGWTLEAGAEQIYTNILQAGWMVNTPELMNTAALRNLPSTWAKRIAVGRDPQAVTLSGRVASYTRSIERPAVSTG